MTAPGSPPPTSNSFAGNSDGFWRGVPFAAFWAAACVQSIVWRYYISEGTPPLSFIVKAELLLFGIASLTTPGIVYAAKRFPLRRSKWLASAVAHFVLAIAFSAIVKLAWDFAILPLYRTPWLAVAFTWSAFVRSLLVGLHLNVLYWLLVIGLTAVDHARREGNTQLEASELRAQLAEARLEALRVQLDPHFLFNTLNGISSLIHSDPDAADQMIVNLSDLLRHSLDQRRRFMIPLREEVGFLRLYLDIQRMRFDARLQVRFEISPAVEDSMVPGMILQPLVENSIRHGIAPLREGGTLVVRAFADAQDVVLEVEDMVGAPVAPPASEGIGLRNTRERLASIYSGTRQLELKSGAQGLIARLCLPDRREVALAGDPCR